MSNKTCPSCQGPKDAERTVCAICEKIEKGEAGPTIGPFPPYEKKFVDQDSIKWFHAPDEYVETFHSGPFNTREEAIAEGKREYDGKPFAIFTGERVVPAEYVSAPFVLDFDWIMEHLEEAIADDVGNEDDIVIVKEGAEKALEKLLVEWASTYLDCKWHQGIDSETVTP